jgi:hypothetical protein
MKRIDHIAAAAVALVGAAFGLAPTGSAAPSSPNNVQDTVNRLQALGYNVELNGSRNAAQLSDCSVTAVHPSDPGASAAQQFTTIWVNISCPPTNN